MEDRFDSRDALADEGARSTRARSPLRLVLLTALSVFVIEILVMLALPPLEPSLAAAMLDSTLLTLLITPALYLFLLRPLVREIEHREHAEDHLRSLNETLEDRVAERTADLSATNERLRRMAVELNRAEEGERRRIAAGLHDLVGESLVPAQLKLGLFKAELSPEQSARIDDVRSQLKTMIDRTRDLSFEIGNPLLYDIGLEAALESTLTRLAEAEPLEVEFVPAGEALEVSEGLRGILYRVVTELLVNVVKHARASRIRLTSVRDDGRVQIVVEDDGVGFSPTASGSWSSEAIGLGLFQARERLRGVGGELRIESTPGKGTRIEVSAPVA